MRITNGMLTSNCLTNINRNKSEMDKLNTQLATQKKIQKPSEDPITAIRALRYRYTSAEISQYLDRNIKDANGWLEVTEDALKDTLGLLEDTVDYFTQASNGTNDLSNRQIIVSTLKNYRAQMYSNANTDHSGRTIFTGYKTNDTYTFAKPALQTSYMITEHFTPNSIDSVNIVKSACDISTDTVNANTISSLDVSGFSTCDYVSYNRIRLAYNTVADCVPEVKYTSASGTESTMSVTATRNSTDANAYDIGDDDIIYLKDTGELIFGKNTYSNLTSAKDIEFTYAKVGFEQGDIKPEQCFDCYEITDLIDPAKGAKSLADITADLGLLDSEFTTKYTYNPDQNISYTINFNQELNINAIGSRVFTADMTRDLDDVINATAAVADLEDMIESLKRLQSNYAEDSTEYAKLTTLIDIKNQERDYAEEKMQKLFESSLTRYNNHFDRLTLEKADIGARMTRLDLSKSRLESQKTVVTTLKTENESVKVTDVAVEYAASEAVYDASLTAAGKVIQKSLLDFI